VILGLPDPSRVRRALDLASSLPRREWRRRARQRALPPLRRRESWLTNASGYRIHLHLHEPDDDAPRPAVVLVPGRDKGGDVFCGHGYRLSADEIAVLGVRVLHFDPVGRGRSWGHDDFCGAEGQDSLRAVLDFTHGLRTVRREQVGVVSFSLGLLLAAPVLAKEGERLGTRFLLDWEGPAERESILRGGPLPPAARTALARDADSFWADREPLQWIARLPCRYVRIQGARDHAHGERGRRNALLLVEAAARGAARSTQLNENRPDTAHSPDAGGDGLDWAPERASELSECLLLRIARELGEPG
jgi:hypothetical protein